MKTDYLKLNKIDREMFHDLADVIIDGLWQHSRKEKMIVETPF